MKLIHKGTLVALALGIFVVACGRVSIAWKEQVQLSSREMIVVQRTALGKSIGELGGSGGWDIGEMTLSPDDGAPAQFAEWKFPFAPILLDRDPETKEWFVVATFYYCTSWYEMGRPKLPYIEYKLHGDRWDVVPLEAKLIGRSVNLLAGPSAKGEPPLLTIEHKKQQAAGDAPKYRTILREWKTAC